MKFEVQEMDDIALQVKLIIILHNGWRLASSQNTHQSVWGVWMN